MTRPLKIRTALQFRTWLARHNLTRQACADIFEMSLRQIKAYAAPDDAAPIPKTFTMALWAYDRGFEKVQRRRRRAAPEPVEERSPL